jgi:hypothetical protein
MWAQQTARRDYLQHIEERHLPEDKAADFEREMHKP